MNKGWQVELAWRCLLIFFACMAVPFRASLGQGVATHETEHRGSKFAVLGVKECAACHSAPSPIYDQLKVTRFVTLTETRDWLQDKHAYAYQLVRIDRDEVSGNGPNALAKSMIQRLGWKADDGNFERLCLTCHAGYNPSASEIELERWNAQREFGIQCEACHGPGSEYIQTHLHQQPTWRKLRPDEKQAHGMIDLHSPNECAKVCMSCHVGDISKSRFITHDMYAAGHPVLPPFELVTFLDAMPPHWKSIQQKPLQAKSDDAAPRDFEFQKEYLKAHYDTTALGDIKASFERTKSSIIGAVAVNDHGISLVRDMALSNKNYRWGDFAMYDCMGCHQELKQGYRRWRPDQLLPGRPYIPKWFAIDVNLVHSNTEVQNQYLTKFISVFNEIPFGDPKRIQSLFNETQPFLNDRLRVRTEFERRRLTSSEVQGWLSQLLKDRKDRMVDYWTARQTGWLAQVALDELVEHQKLSPSGIAKQRDELRRSLLLSFEKPGNASVLESHSEVLRLANDFNADPGVLILEKLIEKANSPPRE